MNAERVGGFFWLLVGLASVSGAIDLGVGTMSDPHSGFMAFVAGVLIVILALSICVKSYMTGTGEQTKLSELWSGLQWWRPIAICLLVLAFILVFDWLGYFVSSLLMLTIIMRWLEDQSWLFSILVPVVVVTATWLLFSKVLLINLPSGIFGL
jgi:hypothetical protein